MKSIIFILIVLLVGLKMVIIFVHCVENQLKILISLKKLCKKEENMKVLLAAIMSKEEEIVNIVITIMNDRYI